MLTTEFLEIAAAICPDRPAMIFEEKRTTFGELQERAQRLAVALRDAGVEAGDTVAFIQVNTPQCVETYFATALLGAIFVPLNFRAKASELEYMIHTADAKVVLAGRRYAPTIDDFRERIPSVREYIELDGGAEGWRHYEDVVNSAEPDYLVPTIGEEATTVLMYTAGTTGFPKGVMLHHGSFTSYVLNNVSPVDTETVERNLLTVPLYHIAGVQAVMAAVYGGRTIVMQRQFDAAGWLGLVQREQVNRAMMVPTMLKQVIDHPEFAAYDLSSLKVITYGAAPMPIEVITRALEAFPNAQFINAFGQTETAATITALSPEDHVIPADLTGEERALRVKRLASVGKPLVDVEMRVVDEAGQGLAPGVSGEIIARGPRVMVGYWKDEEKTQNTKKDGWIYTGDLGYVDEAGYFFLVGRASDIIIRGGENIAPEEVERVLNTHPAVDESAVFGIPDAMWGETVGAAVVLKSGEQASAEALVEWCHERMASYKKPETLDFLRELPRNPLGKVLRGELRERFGARVSNTK